MFTVKEFVLIYMFFFPNGENVIAEREAHTHNWRPVRTMQQCKEVAAEQERRLKLGIRTGNGLFCDVKVSCEQKRYKGKKR